MSAITAQNAHQPTSLRAILPTFFPQDNYFNEVEDDQDNPKLPLLKKGYSQDSTKHVMVIDIDIVTGKVAGWTQGDTATINIKVVDMGVYVLIDHTGSEIATLKDSYVPDALSIDEEGYGDYVYISILADGSVKGWVKADVDKIIEDKSLVTHS